MVKVGDKVRVLKNYPSGAMETIGAILFVNFVEADCFQTTSNNPRFTSWDFNFNDFIQGNLELVIDESKPKLGDRFNNGKLRWRNFPMFLMKPLVEVAQYGEGKYSTFNFLKGQTTLDSMDSLKRHLELFESPYYSDLDDESKVNHLAHVAWNALVALHMLETRPELDDRYKLPEKEVKNDSN